MLERIVGSIIIAVIGFSLFAVLGRLVLIEDSWFYGISALIYFIPISLFLTFVTFILVKVFDEYDYDIYKYIQLATILLSYMASGYMFEQNPTLTQRVDTYLASIHSNQQSASHLISLTELSKQQRQLWETSRQGDLNKVKEAIRDGVDPDFAYDGSSPLMSAIEYGHYDTVEFLLFNGADINKSADGLYPLDKAIDFELARNDYDEFVLLNLLVKAGIDLNVDRGDGQSYLLICIEYNEDNSLKLAEALIKSGADVNLQDDSGMTALMYAAQSDANLSLLNELIDADADRNLKDNNGRTAYSYALEAGNEEAAKIILAGKVIHKIKLIRGAGYSDNE